MGLFRKKTKENSTCNCDNTAEVIKKEGLEKESSCGYDNKSEIEPSTTIKNELTIKILGSGCKNCVTLAENVGIALEEMKLSAKIEKVTDLAEIAGYGVMSTPAMVVNEKVVSYGKVLKTKDVVKMLEKVLGE